MKKLKQIFCVLFGHSDIIHVYWGYLYCGRCGEQIGDSLTSSYDNSDWVVDSCLCDDCKENYKKMGWKDKFWVKNPFKESLFKDDEL